MGSVWRLDRDLFATSHLGYRVTSEAWEQAREMGPRAVSAPDTASVGGRRAEAAEWFTTEPGLAPARSRRGHFDSLGGVVAPALRCGEGCGTSVSSARP